MTAESGLSNKIIFKGKLPPQQLREHTLNAWIGITLFEDKGLSNYYSLANRFFDYIHAGVPQVCVDFPVYREINNQYQIGVMVEDTGKINLAKEINNLLTNEALYNQLRQNCLKASEVYNWQNEEKKLINFYQKNIG